MASYEELYNKIHGENAYEESVKSTAGKLGMKGVKIVKGYIDPENTKVDPDSLSDTEKKLAEKSSKVFNKIGDKGADVIAKKKEIQIKKKYADNPEKMESELKKNINNIPKYKENVMAISIWTASTIPAAVSAGTLDGVLKTIIMAGAISTEDAKLCSAVSKAALWAPLAVKAIADVSAKFTKKEIPWDTVKNTIVKWCDKVEDVVGDWAKSDEPLFIPMQAKSKIEGKSKIDRAVEKGPNWKFNEAVLSIMESFENEIISIDEYSYLLESVVSEYDYQYEAYL